MPEPLVINSQIIVPADELRFTYSRSAGPGGQNVNKLNTKARLHWDLTTTTALPSPVLDRLRERYANRINEQGQIVIASDRRRERARNARDCLEKLRAMILSVLTPPRVRKRTRPSRGSIEARLKSKRRNAQRKRDRKPPPLE